MFTFKKIYLVSRTKHYLKQRGMGRLPRSIRTFCLQTSAHGFRFLVPSKERKNSLAERVVWMVSIVAAFVTTAYLEARTIRNAQENPVVLSLENVPIQVSTLGRLPF